MRDRAASRRAGRTGFFARRTGVVARGVSARAVVRFAAFFAFAGFAGFATFAAAVAFTDLVAFVAFPRFTTFAGAAGFAALAISARFAPVVRAGVPFFDALPVFDPSSVLAAFPFLDALPGFGDAPFDFAPPASFVVRARSVFPFALPAPFDREAPSAGSATGASAGIGCTAERRFDAAGGVAVASRAAGFAGAFAAAPLTVAPLAGPAFATATFVGVAFTGAPFPRRGFGAGAAGAGAAATGTRFVADRRSTAGDGLVWGCWRRSATRLTYLPRLSVSVDLRYSR